MTNMESWKGKVLIRFTGGAANDKSLTGRSFHIFFQRGNIIIYESCGIIKDYGLMPIDWLHAEDLAFDNQRKRFIEV